MHCQQYELCSHCTYAMSALQTVFSLYLCTVSNTNCVLTVPLHCKHFELCARCTSALSAIRTVGVPMQCKHYELWSHCTYALSAIRTLFSLYLCTVSNTNCIFAVNIHCQQYELYILTEPLHCQQYFFCPSCTCALSAILVLSSLYLCTVIAKISLNFCTVITLIYLPWCVYMNYECAPLG